MVEVVIDNLTKKYGKVIAANNVSLKVEDKELIVLLGPSGCGKTTILRCVAGLEKPDGGDIRLGDKSIVKIPPQKRDVAMVFQSYALYPHLKVYDNIAMPLRVRKYSHDEINRRVREAADLLRIGHLLYRRPGQLSGGERQRVALGRAVVREPQVFLMDEPLSNLDAKLRVYMRAELKRLQKDLGTTMIFVTHDQAEAMSMADRIAVMDRGDIQQLGPPEEIYNNPTSTFVGGFIGSPPMNFIDCTFDEKASQLDAGTFRMTVTKDMKDVLKDADSELVLGIRPEDIVLHEKHVSPDLIESEVYVLEPVGSEVIVNLRIGKNLVKAKSAPSAKFKMGDKAWLEMPLKEIRIFSKKTGKSIV